MLPTRKGPQLLRRGCSAKSLSLRTPQGSFRPRMEGDFSRSWPSPQLHIPCAETTTTSWRRVRICCCVPDIDCVALARLEHRRLRFQCHCFGGNDLRASGPTVDEFPESAKNGPSAGRLFWQRALFLQIQGRRGWRRLTRRAMTSGVQGFAGIAVSRGRGPTTDEARSRYAVCPSPNSVLFVPWFPIVLSSLGRAPDFSPWLCTMTRLVTTRRRGSATREA